MVRKLFHPYMLAYVAAVVLVNIGFSYVHPIPTPIGLLSPMAFFVGAIFVLRDFAQRQAGHGVLLAMGVGALLSYALADPFVATASLAAFAASEVADWAIYTLTKRPFHQRILLSSLVSTPIDTAVFLLGIGFFGWGTFAIMFASKMIAAVAVWMYQKSEDETARVLGPSPVDALPYAGIPLDREFAARQAMGDYHRQL